MTEPHYKPAAARRYPGKQRDFVCDHPGCEMFPNAPMLHEDVWNSISNPRGLLCIKHTEEALGRPILVDDLSDCPGNAFTLYWVDRISQPMIVIDSLSDMGEAALAEALEQFRKNPPPLVPFKGNQT